MFVLILYLRLIAKKVKSYIKDTNDFPKKLHSFTNLPNNILLCTIDVVGLYPHILHGEGLCALRKNLMNEMKNMYLSTDTLVKLAKLVLKDNIFYFNGKLLNKKEAQQLGQSLFRPIAFYLWQN